VDEDTAQAQLDAAFGVNARLRAQLAMGVLPREVVDRHKRIFTAPLSRAHAMGAGVVLVMSAALALKSVGAATVAGMVGVGLAMVARLRISLAERAANEAYRAALRGEPALRLCEGEATSFRTWHWDAGDLYVLRLHFQLGDETFRCAREELAKLAFRGTMKFWLFRGPAYGLAFPMVEELIAVELGAGASVSKAREPEPPPSEPFQSAVRAD
jgi:hypothetical protein